MTTPEVVQKQVLDIDFSRGLNESTRPESLDWTKYLKVADNVDFGDDGVIKSRPGLYSVADAASDLYRVMGTGTGVLALGAGVNQRISAFHLNESAPSVAASLINKGPAAEYSVYPKPLGSINGQAPLPIGACYTARYDISVLTPNSIDYFVYFQDRQSGNIVASYTIGFAAGTAGIAMVAGRYLHVYLGQAASAKVFQFDTEVLPTSVPSGVSITSGTYIQAVVANSTTSVVLMRNGNLSRFTTAATPVESATGSVAGFASNEIHDMATDGTAFHIVGLNSTPRGLMKVLNASFATTRTVTDTDATLSAARFSIAVNSFSDSGIVAYRTTTTGAFTMPTAVVIRCSSVATEFLPIQVLPCWGQVSSPYYNSTLGSFYVVMMHLVDAGYGAGYQTFFPSVAGCVALVQMDNTTWSENTPPAGYHCAAVLDAYTDYPGNNSLTKGHIVNPQKLYSADGGLTVVVTSIQNTGPQSYTSEFRTLKMNDVRTAVCAQDIISGGKTCSYDGVCVSELGVMETPWCTAEDAGAGTSVDAGTRSYKAFFEAIDAQGNRHISRWSAPFSLTLAAAKNVNVTVSYPNVSDHISFNIGAGTGSSATNAYNFKYHVYRTIAELTPTLYYRIATGQVTGIGTASSTITFSDTVTDANLQLNDQAQFGRSKGELDRYHPPASSCVVRHKDRVYLARGSVIFYSAQCITGEAPWFNPAFQFDVPGGIGDITALASMDGLLVIFKQNGIWMVEGDGPADSGPSGTEFSPPRRLLTELGCVDARTLISANDGLLYRSLQGLQRLTRKLTVDWVGQRVFRTVDASPYNGGAAFDVSTGRCVWIMSDTAGTYPGQLSAAGTGYAVVYDTTNDTWSRYKLLSNTGAGKAFQDVCYADAGSSILSIPSTGRLVYADSAKLFMEYGRVDHITTNSFVPITLETGWVRSQSKQDRIRVTDFLIAGIRNADCTIATSYAANYSPSYVSVKTWTPSATGALTLVQLETQPPVESVQAMSFKVVTSDPTPTSFGAGTQFDIFGLSVRVGIRGGGAKLPAAQKG